MAKNPCKVCGTPTMSIYNINLKATPICDSCGNAIFMQQATWFGKQEWDRIKEQKEDEKDKN